MFKGDANKDLHAQILFHSFLYLYLKALGPVVGASIPPLLDAIKTISGSIGLNLIKGEIIDEFLQNLQTTYSQRGAMMETSTYLAGSNYYLR